MFVSAQKQIRKLALNADKVLINIEVVSILIPPSSHYVTQEHPYLRIRFDKGKKSRTTEKFKTTKSSHDSNSPLLTELNEPLSFVTTMYYDRSGIYEPKSGKIIVESISYGPNHEDICTIIGMAVLHLETFLNESKTDSSVNGDLRTLVFDNCSLGGRIEVFISYNSISSQTQKLSSASNSPGTPPRLESLLQRVNSISSTGQPGLQDLSSSRMKSPSSVIETETGSTASSTKRTRSVRRLIGSFMKVSSPSKFDTELDSDSLASLPVMNDNSACCPASPQQLSPPPPTREDCPASQSALIVIQNVAAAKAHGPVVLELHRSLGQSRQECAELRSKLTSKEETEQTLLLRIDALQQEVTHFQTLADDDTVAHVKQECAELRSKLSSMEETEQTLLQRIDALQQEVTHFQTLGDDAVARKGSVDSTQVIEETEQTLLQRVDALQQEVTHFQTLDDDTVAHNDSLEITQVLLMDPAADVKSDDVQDSVVIAFSTSSNDLTNSGSTKVTRFLWNQQVVAEKDALKSKVAQLNRFIEDQRRLVTDLRGKLQHNVDMKEQCEEVSAEREAMSRQLAESDRTIADLRRQLEDSRSQWAEVTDQLESEREESRVALGTERALSMDREGMLVEEICQLNKRCDRFQEVEEERQRTVLALEARIQDLINRLLVSESAAKKTLDVSRSALLVQEQKDKEIREKQHHIELIESEAEELLAVADEDNRNAAIAVEERDREIADLRAHIADLIDSNDARVRMEIGLRSASATELDTMQQCLRVLKEVHANRKLDRTSAIALPEKERRELCERLETEEMAVEDSLVRQSILLLKIGEYAFRTSSMEAVIVCHVEELDSLMSLVPWKDIIGREGLVSARGDTEVKAAQWSPTGDLQAMDLLDRLTVSTKALNKLKFYVLANEAVYEELICRHSEAQQQASDLQTEIAGHLEELERVRAKLSANETVHEELWSRHSEAQQQTSYLQSEISTFRDKFALFDKEREERENSLTRKIADLETALLILEEEAGALSVRTRELEGELLIKEEELDGVQSNFLFRLVGQRSSRQNP